MPSNSVCAPGLVLAILCLPAAQASADSAQAVAGPAPLSTATIQVLGGRQVKEGELPWQVALVMSGAVNHVDGVFCGGTLLDSEWVLTAAHCFFNPETCVEYRQQQYWVAYGSADLGRKVSLVGAGKVFLPPGYSCRKNEKDIALIQLKDAISGAVPIRLASRTDAAKYLRVGAGSVSATGWGLTQVDGWKSRNLLKVDIPVTDYGACKAHYGGSLPANAICAGAAGKDTCTGDSGGPLYTGSGKDAIQLGVVSFGDSCGQAKIPGVYTPVAEYRDWIDEVRKPKPCTSEDIRNGRC